MPPKKGRLTLRNCRDLQVTDCEPVNTRAAPDVLLDPFRAHLHTTVPAPGVGRDALLDPSSAGVRCGAYGDLGSDD